MSGGAGFLPSTVLAVITLCSGQVAGIPSMSRSWDLILGSDATTTEAFCPDQTGSFRSENDT